LNFFVRKISQIGKTTLSPWSYFAVLSPKPILLQPVQRFLIIFYNLF